MDLRLFGRTGSVVIASKGLGGKGIVLIDTEANRQAMPQDDHATWLDPAKMAEYLYMLCTSENRPESGSFIELTTEKGAVNAKIR